MHFHLTWGLDPRSIISPPPSIMCLSSLDEVLSPNIQLWDARNFLLIYEQHNSEQFWPFSAKLRCVYYYYLFIFNSRHKAHDTNTINTVQHR